eukprot:c8152_g3_i3.p1 GENE.c8152_g3_i3~~c8152_g3_i3.p1  ORF type:complete len:115 (-),score=8.23 c8152_g3_i3:15-359(-)
MKNGQMLGHGVYLSDDLNISKSYAHSTNSWKHSCIGRKFRCVAVCEIVMHPQVQTQQDSKTRSQVFVVPENYVRVQQVLVWSETEAHFWSPFLIVVVLYFLILVASRYSRSLKT